MENRKVIRVERYTDEAEQAWDDVLARCVNGSFLLKRSFMNYHRNRFEDYSYIVWQGNTIVALFAAAVSKDKPHGGMLVAHPGLTYGGLANVVSVKYALLEEIYISLLSVIKGSGFNQVFIKQVPQVFCNVSNDASLFYFHKNNFKLVKRELNSVLDLTNPLNISKGRKDNIRKARNKGVIVERATEYKDFENFWSVLTHNLKQTHGASPVHTIEEILLLYNLHPDNISLYTGRIEERLVAGVLVFQDGSRGFVHTQYISANEEGKSVGAVDVVLMDIILGSQNKFKRFSFGTSTLNEEVNYGLLNQKEGFGSSAEIVDTYCIEL